MIIHNPILTGSFTVNGTDVASITSSAASITAINSYTASQNILNGTYATTGSNTFKNPQTINSNLIVTGSITAATLVVQTITSSVVYSSGSNVFGNSLANTQTFTGSINITGSTNLTGALSGTSATFSELITSNVTTSTNAIFNSTNASGGFIAFRRSGTNIGYLGNSAQLGIGTLNALELRADNNLYLTTTSGTLSILSTGNVGIGTTSPNKQSFTNALTVNAASSNVGFELSLADSAGFDIFYNSSLDTYLTNRTNGAMVFRTNATERMRITSGGNVGIGTSSPSCKLGIEGTAGDITSDMGNGSLLDLYGGTISSTNYGVGLGFTRAGSQMAYIKAARENTTNEAAFLAFATQTSAGAHPERMRITSGGVTLFGGTTFTTITSAVLGATNPSFTGRNWSFGPNSSGDYVVYHNQGGNTGVYLSYGGSSWTSNSDENIKDIIEVIPNALESIINFRAVKFYWKGDESKKENIGLIAQDVQKSYPELIDKQIFDDKEILGVRYTELIPVLVKAIQELQAQITELKNK